MKVTQEYKKNSLIPLLREEGKPVTTKLSKAEIKPKKGVMENLITLLYKNRKHVVASRDSLLVRENRQYG